MIGVKSIMEAFLAPLTELKEFNDMKEHIKKKHTPVQVTGCIDSQKSHFIYGLGKEYPCKIIVTHNDLKAKELFWEYKLYEKEVYLYPAKDVIFYSADIHGNAIVKSRLEVLSRFIEKEPMTIITTIDAGMDRVLPLEYMEQSVIQLEEAGTADLSKLQEQLAYLGYEKVGQVEGTGQFAVRGGILDVYPLTKDCPYRVEFWDDEIDTIRAFDVESQRSIETVKELRIYPASEIILNEDAKVTGLKKIRTEAKKVEEALRKEMKTEEAYRLKTTVEEFLENLDIYSGMAGVESYISYFYEDTVSFFDYFDRAGTLIFLDEPVRLEEKGKAVELEFRESMSHRMEKGYLLPGQTDILFSYEEIFAKLSHFPLVLLSAIDFKVSAFKPQYKADITVQSLNSYQKNFELLTEDLKRWKEKGYRVILFTGSKSRAMRLSEDLRNEYAFSAFYNEDVNRAVQAGEIMVVHGNLHHGFEYPLIKFVMISETDIFGEEKKKKKKKKSSYEGKKIQSFNDLTVGDYVIHENHGVGIYKGIEKVEVDKVTKDYIKIEYANNSNLYVLATGLDVLQKYAGSEAKRVKLNKLNSLEWKKTKNKARSAVKDIAEELVQLYAKRQAAKGYEYGPDTVWQTEFEELFPYEETEDQLKAIEATKQDMESKKIMDRLICGDVGYGKTEIAIRAAFKAVMESKQVVYLVPTTILAQQHYNTFSQRMKDFPVRVELMSRFRTSKQQKETIQGLKKGSVDIVIGTHRLLSKDIGFKDLGLLIVDEEQRFGVTHKEKIKQLKGNVDVLTLSATPIPRTLHMSLVGIRDMSVLEEAPVDRLPIQTFVLEHNEEIIREAIVRELARDGQVYYVYNRVDNIAEVASMVAKLVPEATVSFAHGQMSARELEKIMYEFINGEIDVLVSTTIVETGLDISNVNTMIIDDADRLGLSQLYQLRGRVGRSNRTAYAFLMYKRDKMLKEVAEKRLQAMREFTDLGSGFKIAMRDLEIRGAGNLLGAKQHGHMEAVGYDLYCKMLNEAVLKLKGEEVADSYETLVDIDIDAYIPPTYIKNEYQKLEMYKRIADIETEEEFIDMQDELTDRFGDMPQSVINLLNIALLKSMAHKAYLVQVQHKMKEVKFILYEQAQIDVSKIQNLVEKYENALEFINGKTPHFLLKLKKELHVKKEPMVFFEMMQNVLKDMQELVLHLPKEG